MKRFTTLTLSLLLIPSVIAGIVFSAPVRAANPNSQSICEGAGGTWTANNSAPSGGVCSNGDGSRTVIGTIQQITDVLVFLSGAIAVLMIIIGGVRYVTSAGDQSGTKSAKDTILYAVIGLVVAFMAYAIVHFITAAFKIK